MSTGPLEEYLSLSEQFLSGLQQLIQQQIINSFVDQVPGVDAIAKSLDALIAQSETQLQQADQYIKSQIEPALNAAVANPISLLQSLAGSLDSHLSELLGEVASAADVTTSVITTLKAHAPDLANWIYHNVSGGLGTTFLNVLKEIETQDTAGIDAVLDEILKFPNMPPAFKTLAHGFRNRNAEWQALAIPALAVGILIGAIEAAQEPFHTAIQQDSYSLMPTKELETTDILTVMLRGGMQEKEFFRRMANQGYANDVSLLQLAARRQLVTPEVAARALIRGEWTQQRFEEELVAAGLDTERARINWLTSQQLLDEANIRNAFLRNIFNEHQHDAALGRLGYETSAQSLMRELYFYIPPVADLIHMGIRNVFNSEIVNRFHLDGDYPADFEKAAREQGVSSEWAHKYWQAHWIMPGREAFFEMFQRTTDTKLDPNADTITLSDGTEVHNIIGESTLALALRDIDTPPFYRDLLRQVAYHPLNRIDIRRMASIGLLNHAQVERAYLDLGYDQHNARRLADFVDSLSKKSAKDQATKIVDNLKSHTVQLYIQGKLSLDAVNSTLADMGFTEAETTALTTEAELIRASQLSAIVEAGIGKLYMAGIIDDVSATQQMQAAGIPVDAMSLLFRKWDLAIQYRGGTEHIHKHRELTKGEVLASYADGLMDQATAQGMLTDMGYDDSGAAAELALADFKAARQSRTTIIDAIKAKFINGVAEALDTSNSLDALGMPSDQRDAYMSEWTLQRETRTERIPLATLRDMFKTDFLSEEDLLTHLRRHRYTDSDAALIISFWKAQPLSRSLQGVLSST